VGKVRAGTIALVVISLPVLAGTFLYGPFVLDLFLHRRPPSRFLIPSGYTGWITIQYSVAGAPPLPREGKFLLVRLTDNGSLQTSSNLPEGWADDQFFYYSRNFRETLSNAGWCKGGMIWGEVIGKKDGTGWFQKFFVGDESRFRIEIDPTGKTYNPC
jgi:uncharacterized protein DUF6843